MAAGIPFRGTEPVFEHRQELAVDIRIVQGFALCGREIFQVGSPGMQHLPGSPLVGSCIFAFFEIDVQELHQSRDYGFGNFPGYWFFSDPPACIEFLFEFFGAYGEVVFFEDIVAEAFNGFDLFEDTAQVLIVFTY
jgi:hypothetical protein